MMELPEAAALTRQMEQTLKRKTVANVIAGASPHKFAWYRGDPAAYDALLRGKSFDGAAAWGGLAELALGDYSLLLGDGVVIRYYAPEERIPEKHQLLLAFEDGSTLVCTVQMYGGMWAFREGEDDNPYHTVAKTKPSPLSGTFDRTYFDSLRGGGTEKLSAKAFLATEQRIPGLGNGVLQDILWRAHIHPKRKISTLSPQEYAGLYTAVKGTLSDMAEAGGRDTEKDLFGRPGGYRTALSRNTEGLPCPVCGSPIQKAPYMGGAVYWCPGCQKEA